MPHGLSNEIPRAETIDARFARYGDNGSTQESAHVQVLSQAQKAKVRALIEACLGTKLSVPRMAAEVCLSPYHFSRLFQSSFGMPPHRYVLQMRIARAAHLLRAERRCPISHIALETGFATHAHLSSTFKSFMGLTPKRWRAG